MSHYYDLRFQRSLDKALEAARVALKSAKCVKLTDEAHAYGDKFAAAEVAVRLATSSSLAFAELLHRRRLAPPHAASGMFSSNSQTVSWQTISSGARYFLK